MAVSGGVVIGMQKSDDNVSNNSIVMMAAATGVGAGIYSKAFLETLAKHHAEALIGTVREWFRRNEKTETGEYLIAAEESATVVVTEDLPDEARLALLDLDVTALELRGRELRWDAAAGAWRPSDAPRAGPDRVTFAG